MTRLPPGSPLFPYTTLFRSVLALGREIAGEAAELEDVVVDRRRGDERAEPVAARDEVLALEELERLAKGHEGQDRKSIRLNSSHLGISYAVFCLKKKKRERHRGAEAPSNSDSVSSTSPRDPRLSWHDVGLAPTDQRIRPKSQARHSVSNDRCHA